MSSIIITSIITRAVKISRSINPMIHAIPEAKKGIGLVTRISSTTILKRKDV